MYEKGRELNIGEDYTREIEANSEREAYLSYIKQIGTHDIAVLVTHSLPSGLIAKKLFDDHVDDSEVFKQKAKKENNFLISKKDDGYFKLQVEEKINSQSYFERLIEESGKRILFDEEIQYLKLWQGFKDREFSQNLLAQSEAGKPKEERGKTKLLQTISTGIVAGNMAKSHQLRELNELNESVDEIAEDVEDHSGEGMGFEG